MMRKGKRKTDLIIICSRRETVEHPIEDSNLLICSRCGKEVWISPRTYEFYTNEAYDAEIICTDCYLEM